MHDPHVILKVISKFLVPFIALFAFYVQFHGDFGPGGGFQAGVILASAVILYALIFGLEAAKKAFPPSWVRIGMSSGVLLYGGTGVLTWILGGDFLSYGVLAHDPAHGQHYGIIAVELGVLCSVTTVMIAIFYAFGSRQPEVDEDNW
ncbi:MAG: Na(+)/H(+) antiporter subunit B [Hellea sp.]|nr:Na(+)/H(+) antiporter subunit B [Hellea sp.]MDG1666286.1 Na(+)/H(+) antiporter subunit B [Hellea sp.]MDG2360941.1 Na(+)/H(+) antiporter subunit B [Hellea sp.]|tara:strand:+ start:95 stop:535 length:441 start_codon:yes stop_codon:yes gene_type:complete